MGPMFRSQMRDLQLLPAAATAGAAPAVHGQQRARHLPRSSSKDPPLRRPAGAELSEGIGSRTGYYPARKRETALKRNFVSLRADTIYVTCYERKDRRLYLRSIKVTEIRKGGYSSRDSNSNTLADASLGLVHPRLLAACVVTPQVYCFSHEVTNTRCV